MKKTCLQIPLKELQIGAWYVGRGRNSNIGQWNGDGFSVIAQCMVYTGSVATVKSTYPCLKNEPYYTDEEGCFQPFLKIDEGEIIERNEPSFIYGSKIAFE